MLQVWYDINNRLQAMTAASKPDLSQDDQKLIDVWLEDKTGPDKISQHYLKNAFEQQDNDDNNNSSRVSLGASKSCDAPKFSVGVWISPGEIIGLLFHVRRAVQGFATGARPTVPTKEQGSAEEEEKDNFDSESHSRCSIGSR
ncbi:unnamed protein product [Chrysoparadoxa australica]